MVSEVSSQTLPMSCITRAPSLVSVKYEKGDQGCHIVASQELRSLHYKIRGCLNYHHSCYCSWVLEHRGTIQPSF